jgi:hypothetical protein
VAAILTGITLGLLLYYASSLIVELFNRVLGLSNIFPCHGSRSLSINEPKRKSRERKYSPTNDYRTGSSGIENQRFLSGSGLLSSTILEEEESNQGSNGDLYD